MIFLAKREYINRKYLGTSIVLQIKIIQV